MSAFETRHLLLLVALEETGSLNAAARRLHLTPSALSLQLRDLEERLGGALFQRRWRRLVATAAGRHLTEVARSVLGELGRAEAEARRLLNGATGTLRLTTACHHSYRWLPDLLKDFARTCPDIEVTVVPEAAASPCEWIVQGTLDVALVAGEIRNAPRVRLEPLFRDELVALVGRGHPWCAKKAVELRAFADQHVWAEAGTFHRDSLVARAFAEAGSILPRRVTALPLTGGAPLELARANLGITLAPRWSAEPALANGELHAVSLGPKGLWLDWSVATRAEEPEPPLEAFLAALRLHHPRAREPVAQRSRRRRS
ncbi:LysR family transcriptional regulator [Archangium violaceum]|uniref:LysR family transcriptional regulator n=1 Tax=Archangium violaceum TaxID=83451 RepID=UPI00193BBEBE|nr:LysR family transcriptional regulator [Archangium violaceum]QRK11520.1 LysR family transcriptional regulator [Archangium violaceum]